MKLMERKRIKNIGICNKGHRRVKKRKKGRSEKGRGK